MAIYLTGSEQATIEFAKKYAATLSGGDVVLLEGGLGAGKTTFCKGIAQGLGIKDEILSPTYAYMNDYDGKLYHYDCYRLKNGAEAERLGLTDYFQGTGVCVIEWSENIADVLPENCKKVTIRKISPSNREIVCE
ncbi:MAG: tRNA (adenosine(37)-N6)-threonylcarbamoyltransferase complex ATPase subunit type 1 TsaE [Clostridia bacterium]|nr:tRNA (adenosine(37)-N6)-threonylcarbamoyltransferase complex ATPase subunit type 1 TsaE [Clostridia bacterium]MDE7401262.1 tRNA (adenosine(37)-N6)-threonylcarbamoyltransferase complex ATPase subunit type 1 TsaE [Clostridia bacterium]